MKVWSMSDSLIRFKSEQTLIQKDVWNIKDQLLDH